MRDASGKETHKIEGTWSESIYLIDCESLEKEEIWRAEELPEGCEDYFYFNEMAMNLNHLSEDLKEQLPPTDSRFRPDQRAVEMGDFDLADEEKSRLEGK